MAISAIVYGLYYLFFPQKENIQYVCNSIQKVTITRNETEYIIRLDTEQDDIACQE